MRTSFLLVLSLVTAAPAAAQIRLPKPKLPTSLPGSAAAPTRQPTFDDRVVEITAARATALLRGLAAEQGEVAKLQELERSQRDQAAAVAVEERKQEEGKEGTAVSKADREKIERCVQESPEYRAATSPAQQARQKAATDRATKLAEQRKYDEMQRISDSLTQATERTDSIMNVVARRCGATEEMLRQDDDQMGPPPPLSEAPEEVEVVNVRDSLTQIGAATAGMTADQYAVMRERVVAFLTIPPQELGRSSWAFGPNELRVLQGKRADLARYQELMTEY